MSKSFDDLLAKVSQCSRKTVSVAVAQDAPILEAVKAAKEKGIADAILVGDEAKIREVADQIGMDLTGYEIVNEPDDIEASLKAVKLVHDHKADMYMKGLLSTKDFLKSVLNKEVGLRNGKPLSHVCVFEIPGIDRLLYLTDVAFMTYPSLEEKKSIIENSVEVAHACGIPCPKVAPLAAVEVVNPKMPVTVDAAELTKMNENGEITGFKMRVEQSKLSTVKALQSIGFDTIASGDSYNDLGMIQASKAGFLFRSTDKIKADYPQIPAYETYEELLGAIKKAMEEK